MILPSSINKYNNKTHVYTKKDVSAKASPIAKYDHSNNKDFANKHLTNNKEHKSYSHNSPLSLPPIIREEEQAIHDKYLRLLTPYNLPTHLADLAAESKKLHKKSWQLKKRLKKKQIRTNVTLPFMSNIKGGHPLPQQRPVNKKSLEIKNSAIIPILKKYKTVLQQDARSPIFSRGTTRIKKINSKIKAANGRLKRMIDYALNKQKIPTAKFAHINGPNQTSVEVSQTRDSMKYFESSKAKYNKGSFSHFKKLNSKAYRRRIVFLKQNLRCLKSLKKKRNKAKFKAKPKVKPLLPWIVEGRKRHQMLKKTLLKFKRQLKLNKGGWRILNRKQKKIIKQFRRKRKFSTYGKFGPRSKFIRMLEQAKAKALRRKRAKFMPKIKRHNLYLQHKLLNNNGTLTHKYMHILIIIWYILLNGYMPLYTSMLKTEMWLSYFYKNIWILYAEPQTNNLFLNYGISRQFKGQAVGCNIYMPSRNPLNNELQGFETYQRLTGLKRNVRHNIKKYLIRSRRKTKTRGFFRLSPRLKRGASQGSRNKSNKFVKSKGKKSRRLADKEWLLVKKFTQSRYQHQFPLIFSQWKMIKKIQKYIDKQSHAWHRPYVVTHPYYYTSRYNTFVYHIPNA